MGARDTHDSPSTHLFRASFGRRLLVGGSTALWFLRLQLERIHRESESKDPLEQLKFDGEALRRTTLQARAEWLRTRLRRRPYWLFGHLRLAETALALDDVACAYASAQGARVLAGSRGGVSEGQAFNLIGECHLRRGQVEAAKEFFTQASHRLQPFAERRFANQSRASRNLYWQVVENLAAVLLLQEDGVGARELLLTLPPEFRTAENQSALSFSSELARRQSENL